MESNKPVYLKNTCRCCLSRKGYLEIKDKLQAMIEFCLNIPILIDGANALSVCKKCYRLILQFNNFKRDVQRKDHILRQKFSRAKTGDIITKALSEAHINSNENGADCELLFTTQFENPELHLEMRDSNTEVMNLNSYSKYLMKETINENKVITFTDELPPLVPISNESTNLTRKNSIADNINISIAPPPLIPIKTVQNFTNTSKNETNLFTIHSSNEQCSIQSRINSYQCSVCRKKFSIRNVLLKHLKGHQMQKNHKCRICGKKYQYPSNLDVHMRVHTGERPFKCHLCGKGFRRWANVTEHLKTHTPERPHTCDACGKTFKVPQHLKRHKMLHADALPYGCELCGKNYSQRENLIVHLRSRHTKERPFLCSACGKGFVNASMLNRHAKAHTGLRPYGCAACPKAYANTVDLRRHEKIHDRGNGEEKEKKFVCLVCNKKFYHACRLARHMSSYRHRKQETEGRS